MNTPAHASDPQINALYDAEPQPLPAFGIEVTLPARPTAVEDRALAAMVSLQPLYDWLHALSRVFRFVPRDAACCPVAYYLDEQLPGYSCSVGDDEVSVYTRGLDSPPAVALLPAHWRAFVKAFDAAFGVLEFVNAREVEALLERNAAAWGIRV